MNTNASTVVSLILRVISCYNVITYLCMVIRSDEGLTLKTSASESLYDGQFTLSTQFIKPNYLVILPPTQHHSFFRNLPPLCMVIFFIFLIIPVTCSNALSLVSTNIMQNPLQRILNDFLIAKFQDDHYISSYEIFFPRKQNGDVLLVMCILSINVTKVT